MSDAKRFKSQARVNLPGSEKGPVSEVPPSVAAHARSAPTQTVSATVIVRRRKEIEPSLMGGTGTCISREALAEEYGPDENSVSLVQAFAAEYGLTATPHGNGRLSLAVSGTEAAMQEAFGVTFKHEQINGQSFRTREGAITLPQELGGHVTAVLGLDNRPQARPHNRVAVPHAANISYSPVQVATLYGFPTGASAAGQTIGLIELGGGFQAADIATYFEGLKQAVPTVVAVAVDGGANTPGDPNGADGEVMLDIEVSAAVAPGAHVAVYFTPNTDQGFIDAISTAVHDTTNKPSVISISWGGPESTWTQQSVTALDNACQAAAAVGITITVAAGDDGSTDGVQGKTSHVDFPASSPHVLACGGTKLTGSGSTIKSEVVWNETAAGEGATGGGVSNLFPLPTWQKNADVPKSTAKAGGRGVPDVAGDADPSTGYNVLVDGQTSVIGGTSAVAPLWAGLIALANAKNKSSAGFINPTLYADPSALNDITSGNNGAFKAAKGWDACTGLGSPKGAAVIAALAPKAPTKKAEEPVREHQHA